MSTSKTTLIGKCLSGLFLVLLVVASVLGKRMNQNQLLGCLIFWGVLASWAAAFFWFASRPYFALRDAFPILRIPCFLSVIALVFAAIQIPIWGAMTKQFPPDHFSAVQAAVATVGVLFGLAGPGAPGIIVFVQRVWEMNKEERRRLKERRGRHR
jgi:uncharacterized membrane protein YidH (DUF202 family)